METRYTKSHEWVVEEDEIGTVGITERLILECGRIDYLELPEVGAEYEQDEPIAVLETREGVEIRYRSPVTGEVIEVNEELEDNPNLINVSPEADGWLFKIRLEFVDELDSLMTDEEYEFFEPEADDDEYDDDDY